MFHYCYSPFPTCSPTHGRFFYTAPSPVELLEEDADFICTVGYLLDRRACFFCEVKHVGSLFFCLLLLRVVPHQRPPLSVVAFSEIPVSIFIPSVADVIYCKLARRFFFVLAIAHKFFMSLPSPVLGSGGGCLRANTSDTYVIGIR